MEDVFQIGDFVEIHELPRQWIAFFNSMAVYHHHRGYITQKLGEPEEQQAYRVAKARYVWPGYALKKIPIRPYTPTEAHEHLLNSIVLFKTDPSLRITVKHIIDVNQLAYIMEHMMHEDHRPCGVML